MDVPLRSAWLKPLFFLRVTVKCSDLNGIEHLGDDPPSEGGLGLSSSPHPPLSRDHKHGKMRALASQAGCTVKLQLIHPVQTVAAPPLLAAW